MGDKDFKRHMAYEAMVILGMFVLLTFICRLWPLLLLVMLGILIAAVRLLFLSSKKVEVIEPLPVPAETAKEPTEKDVQKLAYAVILRRVTELVSSEYPEARWVWEAPDAERLIREDQEAFILLNRAGGYRRARVVIRNLRVLGVEYGFQEPEEDPDPKRPDPEPENQNYELLAFEWADAHMFDLNARCNEAIGENLSEVVLLAEELPVRESWADICRELERAGLEDVQCVPEGIRINLTQSDAERK